MLVSRIRVSVEGDAVPRAVGESALRLAVTASAQSTDGKGHFELIERHVGGDCSAFAEIVRAYGSMVFSYLARTGVARADQDDLFQEIFLRIHHGAAHLVEASSMRSWIFAITINSVRSHFRRARVRAIVQFWKAPGEHVAATEARPDDAAEANQTAGWIQGELARLPAAQREVVLLCCVEGIEQSEAAQILRVPLGTVKTRLRRARLTLADALERRRADGEVVL